MEPLFAAIFQKVEDPALNEATLRKELTPLLKQLGPQLLQSEGQIQQMRQALLLEELKTQQDLLPHLFHECAQLEFSQEFQDKLRNLNNLMDQLEE